MYCSTFTDFSVRVARKKLPKQQLNISSFLADVQSLSPKMERQRRAILELSGLAIVIFLVQQQQIKALNLGESTAEFAYKHTHLLYMGDITVPNMLWHGFYSTLLSFDIYSANIEDTRRAD